MKTRIIPRLEIKGPNLIKGVHIEGLRVLGNPRDFARTYYEEGADELIYIDIVASLYDRRILPEVVADTAKDIFIPLTVGGGIRTLEDIEALLSAGADKVAINTAAIKNPKLIEQAAKTFGSQCIVVAMETKRMPAQGPRPEYFDCFVESGRQPTGVDAVEWAKQAIDLGAGEILVTSVDREGTMRGYEIDLVASLKKVTKEVPLIIAGGAGRKEHVLDLVHQAKPDAICCSSIFHYHYLLDILKKTGRDPNEIDFLKYQANYNFGTPRVQLDTCAVKDLKTYLFQQGVPVRTIEGER